MPVKTILIVEDNLVNQKLITTVLRPYGYRLLTAVDGEQAVQMARQELPDLILMDLQLPKMNGFTATEKIRGQAATTKTPIVALTAHAMPEQRELAEKTGFDGYITKPIDTRSFPNQISDFLKNAGG